MKPFLVTAVLVALATTGCSGAASDAHLASAADEMHTDRPTPAEVVHDPDSLLMGALVEPDGDGYRVSSAWSLGNRRVVATSDDGFETVTYERWRPRSLVRSAPRTPQIVGLEGLLTEEVHSLAPGVRAVVAGGDGATLFPFAKVARSTDGGGTWRTYDVSGVDRVTAYTSGQVVLPDGRMLVLLNQWSDDRNGHPSDRPHGPYVSAGDDWSHYAPTNPTFRPALSPTARGWPPTESIQASPGHGGVIWMTTHDGRVYASTDAARTFREIPVR